MPVHNVEEYISISIRSILNQTFEDFELIVINDGSTDSTERAILSIVDKRIKYYNRPSLGIVEQLNYGLLISNGSFIARMDGDDISHTTRFLKQYNFLKKHSEIHAVGTNYIRIDKNGKALFKKMNPQTPKDCRFIAPLNTPILHASLFTHKDVLIGVGGYDKEYETIEDYDIFNKMIARGYNLANVNDYLYYYRFNKNLVNSPREKKQQRLIYSYGEELLKTKICSSEEKDSTPFYQLALLEYYFGNITKARKYFLKTIKLEPRLVIKIFRYLPLILLGNKIVKYLRSKKILYNISVFINSKFRIDLKGF